MGCMESRENVQIPWELSSLSRNEWLEWKKCFLSFIHQKYIPPYKQIHVFFKYVGFLGEEISNQLYFYNSKHQADLKTMLFKFDVYFIFGGTTRRDDESIEDYIFSLKDVTESAENNINIETVIKEKILQDFKSRNIFQQLQKLSFSSSITDYESLSLCELLFLLNECEKSVQIKQYLMDLEQRKHTILQECQEKQLCRYCARNHNKLMKCYAIGKKCWNCDNSNHFARCCLKSFVEDCNYCGSSHAQSNCPAFTKECSKCKQMNHFSWKCFREVVLCCVFCGRSHINNRQYCTAKDSRCTKCKRVGHFTSQCLSGRNRHRR